MKFAAKVNHRRKIEFLKFSVEHAFCDPLAFLSAQMLEADQTVGPSFGIGVQSLVDTTDARDQLGLEMWKHLELDLCVRRLQQTVLPFCVYAMTDAAAAAAARTLETETHSIHCLSMEIDDDRPRHLHHCGPLLHFPINYLEWVFGGVDRDANVPNGLNCCANADYYFVVR